MSSLGAHLKGVRRDGCAPAWDYLDRRDRDDNRWRADLSRSKLQPHTGSSKNRWAYGKDGCASDVIALVEQILHRDKHIEPVTQAVRSGSLEGEITSQ
jgi:hypothetical protein